MTATEADEWRAAVNDMTEMERAHPRPEWYELGLCGDREDARHE